MSEVALYEYVVLKFVRDEISGDSIPFGILYWKDDPKNFQVRVPLDDERLPGDTSGLTALQGRFLARLARYLETGEVPYFDGSSYSEDWWSHLKALLIHRFRLDGPRKIQVSNPELDFELQYSALVRPTYAVAKDDFRIDSWVNDALGGMQTQFKSKTPVEGFRGRKVQVLKKAVRGNTVVAIDAVNLTREDAATQLEAMILRAYELLHYHSQETGEDVRLVLGYYASPSGLNGEAKLVELGQSMLDTQLINLSTGKEYFRAKVEQELAVHH